MIIIPYASSGSAETKQNLHIDLCRFNSVPSFLNNIHITDIENPCKPLKGS